MVTLEDTITTSNVIRRRWLDNDYFGGILQGSRAFENGDIQFGLGAFQYAGEHFGNPIWMEAGGQSLSPQHRYYDNLGEKSDQYGFISGDQRLADGKVNIRGEVQLRQVGYTVNGTDNDLRTLYVDTTMTFNTTDATIHMHCVVKVNIVGRLVDTHPGNRFAGFVTFTHKR